MFLPLKNTPQAAEHVNLAPRTLEDFRSRGGGPKYRRLGNRILYRPEDLDSWVDSHSYGSTSEYPQPKEAA